MTAGCTDADAPFPRGPDGNDERQPSTISGPTSARSGADLALRLRGHVAPFTSDGARADVEYRDLLGERIPGAVGAKHIRAIAPFSAETGWHWHDMTAHFVHVLRGWIAFRFAGAPHHVVVRAGSSLSQPAGVAHNVVGRSDDLELIEINVPADYGTWDVELSDAGQARPSS